MTIIRTFLKAVFDRLRRRRLFEQILIATVAVVIGGIMVGVAKQANLSAHIELWWLIPVAVVGAGAGYLVALPTSDLYYKAERTELQSRLTDLEPLRPYIETLRQSLLGFRAHNLKLTRFPDDPKGQLKRVLCEAPSRLIQEATHRIVGVSIWLESSDDGPDRCYEVAFSTDHGDDETDEFNKIPVESSWLYHSMEPHGGSSEGSPLVGISHLATYADGHPDVKVFRSFGYESFLAFRVEINGKPVRFVFLSKEADTFGALEDLYLVFLWCVVTIASGQT